MAGSDRTRSTHGRPRMPMSERAKIFIPFNPLEGFSEALREQDRLADEREADGSDGGVGNGEFYGDGRTAASEGQASRGAGEC